MECPKCGGGCLLSEEELVKILEEARQAIRAVIKATYICRACAEKFSRLFIDDLSKRKRPEENRQYASSPETPQQTDPPEGLKFF
jgi:Zn-finger nucleic acid-binding protein